MYSRHAEKLAEMIFHSRTMLENANKGNWETVLENERIRHDLIDSYFSQPIVAKETQQATKIIQEMLSINDQLVESVSKARDKLSESINSVKQGRRAVKAYATHRR